MLPANFNNFIYSYSANNVITREQKRFGYYDNNAFTEGFFGAIEDFGTALGNVWKAGGKYENAGFKDIDDGSTSRKQA